MRRIYSRWRQYFFWRALIITCINRHQRQVTNVDVENENVTVVTKRENKKKLTDIAADSGRKKKQKKQKKHKKSKKLEILGEHFSTRSFVKFSDFKPGSSVSLFVAQLASFSAALHHLRCSYDAAVNTGLLGTNCHNGALSSTLVCVWSISQD